MSEDLDQVFTSAQAAMAFALRNWDQFCEYLPTVIDVPCPISQATMREHAIAIGTLIDPLRLPA